MTSSEMNRIESRIPELDGIRGVAILMVLCFHSSGISQRDSGWLANTGSAIVSFGWTGVDLFFVLSGFLLGGILIDHQHAPNYFRIFYIRRVCRIFPLYFLWLILYYLAQSFLYPPFHQGIFHLPKWGYIFFLQNYYRTAINDFDALWMGHTWSLAVEEQFYLLLPAAMLFLIRRKPVPMLIAFILLVPLFRVIIFLFYPSLFIFPLLPCRGDSLLLGVLFAYIIRQKPAGEWLAKDVKTLQAIFFFLSLGMAYLISLGYRHNFTQVRSSFEMTSYGFTLVALFYACMLLIAVVDKTSLMARLLRSPVLRHFGIIAYGLYIIHPAVQSLMVKLVSVSQDRGISVLSRNLISVSAFLAAWLLATLSWRFFEKPIVQWGHSFRYAPCGIPQKGPVANPVGFDLSEKANQSE